MYMYCWVKTLCFFIVRFKLKMLNVFYIFLSKKIFEKKIFMKMMNIVNLFNNKLEFYTIGFSNK